MVELGVDEFPGGWPASSDIRWARSANCSPQPVPIDGLRYRRLKLTEPSQRIVSGREVRTLTAIGGQRRFAAKDLVAVTTRGRVWPKGAFERKGNVTTTRTSPNHRIPTV